MHGQTAAFYNLAPMAGSVIRLPVTITAARFVIPTAFAGRRCRWKAIGGDVDIAFGDGAVAVTLDTPSTVAGEAITIVATSGKKLVAGVEDRWVMPTVGEAGFFAVDGSATCTLEITAEE